MLKEPKAGEYWLDRDEDDYIVLVVGFDHSGDPVIEDKCDNLDAYEMATFLKKFKYEPDCDGFNWVKPEPVESPDDWVTQDVVVPRNNIDEWAWVIEGQIPREIQWDRGNGNFKYRKHGDKSCNEILHVRCRRSQLPEPAKTRVELRLWVNQFTGEIVHDRGMNTMDDWHEVLFDTTGQPYYLKD